MDYVQLAENDDYKGLLGIPDQTPVGGLIIIQEIFGINHVMQELVERYTSLGFLTLCPDLFWRFEPGILLDDRKEEDWAQASKYYQAFSEDQGIHDLKLALSFLKTHALCTGKVGTMGFCLGGKLAYLMATRSNADCNVSYYGVGIQNNLNESGSIQNPLLCHLAEKDSFVPIEAQAQIIDHFKDSDLVTIHQYAGVDHAFARMGGANYNEAAAAQANQRSLDFLRSNLV
jgi:carboxymethylenebutenolidase